MTEKTLLKTFEEHGVKRVWPLDEPFDPNVHEALFEAPDPSVTDRRASNPMPNPRARRHHSASPLLQPPRALRDALIVRRACVARVPQREPGTIMHVASAGFSLNDRVIRAAGVGIVAKR